MTFGERLVELRKERGFVNRNDFANYIGMPSTTLRNYETNVREPGHVFLRQMADIFHVSIDYLLCMTDEKNPPERQSSLSTIESSIIKKYRALDAHGKDMVDVVLDKEYDRCSSVDNHILLRAAHERTDIEVTDEMRKHDDDIMNDENF